ncbi:hypothetical protein OAQ84_01390, partial [Bdellovibrionales bacterium]|nr:hypothetical protein [Bdellovibrionales bacterium]
FSQVSNYGELADPHSRVHDGTLKIFENLDDTQANFSQIEKGVLEMERASEEVFHCLDSILKGKKIS